MKYVILTIGYLCAQALHLVWEFKPWDHTLGAFIHECDESKSDTDWYP